MSELRITSPKLLIANMEQEISNFLDEATQSTSDIRHRMVSDSEPTVFKVLAYNSYTEKPEDGLGRFMLLPGVVLASKSPSAKRIFRKGSIIVRGNNTINTYQQLEPTIRQNYNIRFDSEFDIDLHCQVSFVYIDGLLRNYVMESRIPSRFLVAKPIYDKVITGF